MVMQHYFNLALCKITLYLQDVIAQVAKTMQVFASIDRFLITSDRVSFRALSTSKRAKISYKFYCYVLVNIVHIYSNSVQHYQRTMYKSIWYLFNICCCICINMCWIISTYYMWDIYLFNLS